jgi:hypothetical protein
MRANCTITLIDVESIQDETTGDRTVSVTNYRKIQGEKTSVGMSTFWSAAAANVQLDYSVNIRSRMYGNQKYAVIQNKLYEIYNTGKADDPVNIRLNMSQVKDKVLKEAILNVVGSR